MRKAFVALPVAMALALTLAGCTKSAAQEASESIDAIGEVTLDSRSAIEQAREKYDALSDEEKGKVENSNVLEDATKQYQELMVEKECFDLIDSSYPDFQKAEAPFSLTAEASREASAAIADELERLSSFDESSIANESFRTVFGDYKSALQSQIDGLAGYPNDAEAYNSKYIEQGVSFQDECLARFENDFGLKPSFEYGAYDYLKMASLGTPYVIDTEKGQVELTIEGFAASDSGTETVREVSLATDSQECGFLLCTVRNISHPVSDEYEGRLRLDELCAVCDLDGIQLTKVDASLRYPGYECGGAGTMGVYSGSSVQVGEAKRVGFPFIVDSDLTEAYVELESGEFLFVPIAR